MFYGLDTHKEFIQICALEAHGPARRDFRIGASAAEIDAFAGTLSPADELVLEATFHSRAVARRLERSGARVVVANPLQVKAIAHARIKTDKVDAHTLAQLLRAGFVPEVTLPDDETWALRQLVAHRRLLVKQRTAAKNAIHALLNGCLLHYEGADGFNGPGRKWLACLELERHERFVLDNTLAQLDATAAHIAAVDAQLLEFASVRQDAQLLMTIPGVDVTVAIGLLSAIGDVQRFPSPGELASYVGLVQRLRQSAGRRHSGGITKAGRSLARCLAVEAAQNLARSGAPITASYHRIRRKSGHNVAVVALARKLVVLIWHMLRNREPYRYAPPTRTRSKLRRVQPDRRRAAPGQVPQTLERVYTEAALPALSPPSPGEKRAAASNRRMITRLRKQHSQA